MVEFVITTTDNHCSKCGFELKISFRRASIKYRCLECKYYIPMDTQICNKHGDVGFIVEEHAEKTLNFRCKNCGHKEIEHSAKTKTLAARNDNLFREMTFDRKMIRAIQENTRNNDSQALIKNFFESLDRRGNLDKLDKFIFPEAIFNEILENTECDKNTEKSQLKNIIYWFLSTFMSGNLEALAIKAVSSNSERNLSRSLTNNAVISPNALGVRLEKDKVISALEQLLQLCTGISGTTVFNGEESLRPIFYDWMYITKNGGSWEICHKLGKGDDNHGFKIGVGVDWFTKSIVSLVFHGEEHPNDNLSFQRDLCITDIPGLVHITDRGPFDTYFMASIHKKSQYFVIRLKKNIKYTTIHSQDLENQRHRIDISSNPEILLYESKIIKLDANPELPALKYVKFRYNKTSNGQFETIELISNLPLDVLEIIELSAQRWRATETEFNILQHGFGLEKVFVQDPEKVWPLFLISLICKSVLEMILKAIHSAHGGRLDMASFKINLGTIIEHIAWGRGDKLPLTPCDSAFCPYRRKRGLRKL